MSAAISLAWQMGMTEPPECMIRPTRPRQSEVTGKPCILVTEPKKQAGAKSRFLGAASKATVGPNLVYTQVRLRLELVT